MNGIIFCVCSNICDPTMLASSASEILVKTKYESQNVPLSSLNVQQTSTVETRIWQVCHRWWYGLWHRRRIEFLSEITFILEQSEWPIAKDVGPFSRRFNARHWQTFCDLVNVYVFESGIICMHGKELLRQFAAHQKYRRKSHFWSR